MAPFGGGWLGVPGRGGVDGMPGRGGVDGVPGRGGVDGVCGRGKDDDGPPGLIDDESFDGVPHDAEALDDPIDGIADDAFDDEAFDDPVDGIADDAFDGPLDGEPARVGPLDGVPARIDDELVSEPGRIPDESFEPGRIPDESFDERIDDDAFEMLDGDTGRGGAARGL